MSWENFDILGDSVQDENFGAEVSNDPNFLRQNVESVDGYDDDYESYDDDYEDYDESDEGNYDEDDYYDYADEDVSYFDISDIDFSSLDSKNFKSNLKQVRRAVKNKPVVSRTKSKQLRPIGLSKRPVAKRPVAKPVMGKPVVKPTAKPVAKKPLIKTSKAEQAKKLAAQKKLIKSPSKPIQKPISKKVEIGVKKRATIKSKDGARTTKRILVPEDRTVIVEGVDRFMLSNNKNAEAIRQIGYYKGEKLKELVLIINNTTPNDIDLELFNPSQPLDYLFATSQNLNNVISVAGDNKVAYTDVLYNLLANPALLPNAKFTVTGANPLGQFNQPLIFKNKNIAGFEKIHPIQNNLNIDIDQNQNQIVYWNILETLGRAYIPDGMDVIQYKVLAGNSVVFGFYYKQVSLKRFFWKEARDKRIL